MARIHHVANQDAASPFYVVGVITDGDWAHMVATNGFSVGYTWGKAPGSKQQQFFMSPAFAREARRLDWEESEPRFAIVEDKKLWLYSDDFFITCPATVQGPYTSSDLIKRIRNHEGDGEGSHPAVAEIPTHELIEKLAALTQFEREKNVLAVSFGYKPDGELRMSTTQTEVGEAEFYISYKGEFSDEYIANGAAIKQFGKLLQDMSAINVSLSRHASEQLVVLQSDDVKGIFCAGMMTF